MTSEEKLLAAKTEDLYRLCDKYCEPQFSAFLNETEVAFIKKNSGIRTGYNICFFGGYSDACRTVMGVFPEWIETEFEKFPVKAVKITKKYNKNLTHRDYLGTVLSKGITREQVGDIVIDSDTAYIFILEDMAEFIAFGIDKIANVGVKSEAVDCFDIKPPEPKFEIISTVAASVRLDAVVAAMLKLSRKEAASLIVGEKINVNHLPAQNASLFLKEGDVISVRGSGRFVFDGILGTTRSNRIHIIIKKYI